MQAHNRWLADFCADAPGRRAGIAQIFLNDVDDACAEVRGASEHMSVFGGMLLPSGAAELGTSTAVGPVYEPLWKLCEELDVAAQRPQRERHPRLR